MEAQVHHLDSTLIDVELPISKSLMYFKCYFRMEQRVCFRDGRTVKASDFSKETSRKKTCQKTCDMLKQNIVAEFSGKHLPNKGFTTNNIIQHIPYLYMHYRRYSVSEIT